jgi:uncharacterized DUF497 family protein
VATVTFGDFEWDAEKARANAAKHGVAFEEAVTVFLDIAANHQCPLRDTSRARSL